MCVFISVYLAHLLVCLFSGSFPPAISIILIKSKLQQHKFVHTFIYMTIWCATCLHSYIQHAVCDIMRNREIPPNTYAYLYIYISAHLYAHTWLY